MPSVILPKPQLPPVTPDCLVFVCPCGKHLTRLWPTNQMYGKYMTVCLVLECVISWLKNLHPSARANYHDLESALVGTTLDKTICLSAGGVLQDPFTLRGVLYQILSCDSRFSALDAHQFAYRRMEPCQYHSYTIWDPILVRPLDPDFLAYVGGPR